MFIHREQFEQLVNETIDSLPKKFKDKLHNVAIFIEDYPTKQQLKKLGIGKNYTIFGLFEGYAQAKRLNFGPVLPDRITIFRQAILKNCSNIEQCKHQIISTVKHEIAHHFGSDEPGARKASKRHA